MTTELAIRGKGLVYIESITVCVNGPKCPDHKDGNCPFRHQSPCYGPKGGTHMQCRYYRGKVLDENGQPVRCTYWHSKEYNNYCGIIG